MKIIQVPFCYYPDAVGGTEVYVKGLAKALKEMGADVLIAAPAAQSSFYKHEDMPIRRFGVSENVGDLKNMYGSGDIFGAANFAAILDQEKPDIVHFHAFTRGASLLAMREAKKRKIKVILTYHTPTVSCQRGTMMRWGSQICDGKVDDRLCAQCVLQSHGMPKFIAIAVGSAPAALGDCLNGSGLSGPIWTSLRMRSLMQMRKKTFFEMLKEVDHVVAVCDWVKGVLLINGVSEKEITLSRQGVSSWTAVSPKTEKTGSPLRIVFLGRLDRTKGAHILLKAVRQLAGADIALDIFGVGEGASGKAYLDELRKIASDDQRIQFCESIPSDKVTDHLAGYDVLAVPSQWLETGPLVALEAFQAGIPVIGSRLGGISELIHDGVNGILVEPAGSVDAWAASLKKLSENKSIINSLTTGVSSPRTMNKVAEEMLILYHNLREEKS